MKLGGDDLCWESTFKYFGVTFKSGFKLSVDTDVIKRTFYASCNCILGNAFCLNELIKLNLMESYCLPILSYASVAIDFSNAQLSDLNTGWNSVFRRIFGFNKWNSVTEFIAGLGRLNLKFLRSYLCLKFVKFGIDSENSVFSDFIKRYFVSEEFKNHANRLISMLHLLIVSLNCQMYAFEL